MDPEGLVLRSKSPIGFGGDPTGYLKEKKQGLFCMSLEGGVDDICVFLKDKNTLNLRCSNGAIDEAIRINTPCKDTSCQ